MKLVYFWSLLVLRAAVLLDYSEAGHAHQTLGVRANVWLVNRILHLSWLRPDLRPKEVFS